MRKMTFCEIVLDQLPYITKREREAIRTELEDHLDDHAAMLEGKGIAPEEARTQAEEAMGDPEEIGKALAKQYPRLWLWAYRLLTLCVVVVALLFICQGPVIQLYYHHSNLMARTDPWGNEPLYPAFGDIVQYVDFQAELLTDILRVYRVQVNPEAMTATICFVTYDQNPWGTAGNQIRGDCVSITNQEGEPRMSGGSHLSGVEFFDLGSMTYSNYAMLRDWVQFVTNAEVNLGAAYGYRTVPITSGDDHLVFRYERFGVEAIFDVPLPDWEGTE